MRFALRFLNYISLYKSFMSFVDCDISEMIGLTKWSSDITVTVLAEVRYKVKFLQKPTPEPENTSLFLEASFINIKKAIN